MGGFRGVNDSADGGPRKYQIFLPEEIGQISPWEKLQGQVPLGGQTFVERLQPGLRKHRPIKEIPRKQRLTTRPTLGQLCSSGALADCLDATSSFDEPTLSMGTACPRSKGGRFPLFDDQSDRKPGNGQA